MAHSPSRRRVVRSVSQNVSLSKEGVTLCPRRRRNLQYHRLIRISAPTFALLALESLA